MKNIETLIKFGITEEIINCAANNESIMAFRDGAIEFLKTMHDKNIPIIVISAGVGNIIEQFLIS
jgi:2-hydroxy-3-keto-5-methylthiopentenyl-1-phosphate phosphatase